MDLYQDKCIKNLHGKIGDIKMDKRLIDKAFESKRKYFDEGHTQSYEFRIKSLEKLETAIKNNECLFLSKSKKYTAYFREYAIYKRVIILIFALL